MADWYEETMRAWFQTVAARAGMSYVAAVTPIPTPAPTPPPATSDEEAYVRLIFEEDDAIQRRVVQAIQDLFFGAEGRFGTGPKRNCQALQRQLFDTVSPEDAAFKKAVEAAFGDRVAQALDRIVAEELEKTVAKHVAIFDKASRRIAAAPKGPRK